MAGVGIALLAVLGLLIARLNGITTLGPWGVATVFIALVAGVTGISLFTLGVTFNYLVSMFYRQPVRQGLFGRPIFKKPLDRHFGWMGLAGLFVGLLLGIASLGLGLMGWDIARLWLYLLGSAMIILMSLRLMIDWILVRVLDELSQREIRAKEDMQGDLLGET